MNHSAEASSRASVGGTVELASVGTGEPENHSVPRSRATEVVLESENSQAPPRASSEYDAAAASGFGYGQGGAFIDGPTFSLWRWTAFGSDSSLVAGWCSTTFG